MISERHATLANLYALDQLAGAEKLAFEAELATNAELRAHLERLRRAAARPAPAGGAADPLPVGRLLLWTVAAGCALVAVWLGVRVRALRAENDALGTQRDLADVAARLAQAQLAERTLLAERMITELGTQLVRAEDLRRLKIAALHPLLNNASEARAIAVWDPERQTGILAAEKLPVVAEGQDYQLWLTGSPHPAPVAAGVFKPDSTGKATHAFEAGSSLREITGFAVSLEKRGGAPTAGGVLVLRGNP